MVLLSCYRTMVLRPKSLPLINGYFGTPGTKEEVYKIKEERLKYALDAGMNGIGFFEPDDERVKGMDFQDPVVWQDNLKLFKTILDEARKS